MAQGAGKGKERAQAKKAAASGVREEPVAEALEEVAQLESALEDGHGSGPSNEGSLPTATRQLPGADTVAANVLRMRNEKTEARLQAALREAEDLRKRLEEEQRASRGAAGEASCCLVAFYSRFLSNI